jgi:endonuclease/exonuclease/phosphatase family metal-dependent hydrolase
MPKTPALLLAAALALATGCAAPSNVFIPPEEHACSEPVQNDAPALRVVSFNIRAGLSSSLEAVGDVLAQLDADVIALQEVDVGVARSGRVNQAEVLAARLGYAYAFAAAIKREGGHYGVAMLSRKPIAHARRIELRATNAFEPRVAIDAGVCSGGREVRVITVHADMLPWAAAANAHVLARSLEGSVGQGVVLAGDLNAGPRDEGPRLFGQLGLADLVGLHDEGPTFLGGPSRRLDYIFTDPALGGKTGAGRLDVRVSDHIPIFADIALEAGEPS